MEGTRQHLEEIAKSRAGVLWVPAPLASRRLTIRGIGHRELMEAGTVLRSRGTDDHLIMIFETSALLEIDGHAEEHAAGSCIFWRPGMRQSYGNPRQTWSHSWIHLDGDAVAEAITQHRIPCGRAVRLADPAMIDHLMPLVRGELQTYARPDLLTLEPLIDCLLRQIGRAAHAPDGEPRIPAGIAEARAFIDQRYATTLALPVLAKRAGLTSASFSTAFKRWYGSTPVRYVQNQRMRMAAHLLLNENVTVGAVATRVGISDPFYFSRLFRRHHGVSPEAFRRGRARG